MSSYGSNFLDIPQSAEFLGPSKTSGHTGRSVHRQLVARGSTRGPGITTGKTRREQHGRHSPRVSLPSWRSYSHS